MPEALQPPGDDDGLVGQECLTTHAVAVCEAAAGEERVPLCPAQQWRVLPDSLGVSDLAKEPPAVGETKGDLCEGVGRQQLIDDDEPRRPEQLMAVLHGVAHKGCRVEHIRCDQKVARPRGEALPPRVGIDVEQRVEDERVRTKASTRGAEKDLAG